MNQTTMQAGSKTIDKQRKEEMYRVVLVLWLLSLLGCGSNSETGNNAVNRVNNDKGAGKRNVVLFVGDSLTAGYGLAKEQAYPALLRVHWKEQGVSFRVRNVAVSGFTTADVLENLRCYLGDDVHTVFLAIGANDALRGQDLDLCKRNIASIVDTCQKSGAQVVLAGIKITTNYGKRYTGRFSAIYPELSTELDVKLMPFLLQDVAMRPEYNLPDGLHPNAAGHKIIARNVLNFFKREQILR